jgi:hypothetical protein
VNVALPAIQHDLNAPVSGLQWTVDDDGGFAPNEPLTGSAKSMLDELVRATETRRPLHAV